MSIRAASREVKVGIRFPPCARGDQVAHAIRRAEDKGFDVADSAVKPLEMRPSRIAHMRESIGMVRSLLDGDHYPFGNHLSRLRDAVGRVPVHVSASGPRTLALAGEIADGAITLAGIAPEIVAQTRRHVDEGCARSGRHLADVEFTVGTSAGGPASRGIPTVMFGVPEEGAVLADDYVRLSAVRAEYAILKSTVANFFRLPGCDLAGSAPGNLAKISEEGVNYANCHPWCRGGRIRG